MPSRVRRYESTPRYIAAFVVLFFLASTGRGQALDTPPSPDPSEDTSGEGRSEGRTAAEATEAEDFIETDRNSFTFARVTPGVNRLIVESSYSYINLEGYPGRAAFSS